MIAKGTWKLGFFVALALLIVASAYCGYTVVDQGVTVTHMSEGYDRACAALNASTFMLERIAPAQTKERLIAVAREVQPSAEPFEKEGATYVGSLGFRFDSAGGLEAVVADSPCSD